MRIGLDVGSTTLKCVVTDDNGNIKYTEYKRHFSRISEMASEMLMSIKEKFGESTAHLTVSGSAGMGVADAAGLQFAQEVYATRAAVSKMLPGSDAVIELGGEDAKILFLGEDVEVRMNGSCAGGTGAFIDQMATLLGITPDDMDALAAKHKRLYTIASRCGVFAKSDIQPLINQGASLEDVSASIFYAVVNQTIAGLAQGRELEGNIVYLGGPLTFMPQLREAFDKTLGKKGTLPDHSLYFVAYGASLLGDQEPVDIAEAASKFAELKGSGYRGCPPLFNDKSEYDAFKARHALDRVETVEMTPNMEVALGVDAGSTTVKCVAINDNGDIVFSRYMPNSGSPVAHVREFLAEMYAACPGIKVVASGATGYGEELIKNAFNFDCGIVETVAHYTAAKRFRPDVSFIIDIGGQDIKCFCIKNGAIDNIFLNEACSSGCGSFLMTFAGALGYTIEEFANKGIFADNPVDLGSRCTVFMNSAVKQAQKDGASVENISAGLSISVVKNALYKVIRAGDMGKSIVVQGGTFLNDAVLRAFEQETGLEVSRPNIAGLMGAYGAALWAKGKMVGKTSTTLTAEELAKFAYETKSLNCGACQNNCQLTVYTFSGGRKFISGNKCSKPVDKQLSLDNPKRRLAREINMYEYNRSLLDAYRTTGVTNSARKIGIPLGLNMYELLPFWSTLFKNLGFEIVVSPYSDRELYIAGQHTIPSDTVCFPAKLMHGHIDALINAGVDTIFYPCMSYNLDEGLGDNHYNCPVVAYYPEVLAANVPELRDGRVRFIYDYVGLHRPRDFKKKFHEILTKYYPDIARADVAKAVDAAYAEYYGFMGRIAKRGEECLEIAKKEGLPVIILAGRPYHLDPETNHQIDRLIADMGIAVVTEDAISPKVTKFPVKVLNQWTYHSRLYAAAKFVAENADPDLSINLVQLVSFGCGLDAVTTDECRRILEEEGNGKIYTQIKIDEITNPGAVKIRLRSLMAAVGK